MAGMPGCVMYYRTSIFDLVIPRLLAGETVTAEDIAAWDTAVFARGVAAAAIPFVGSARGSRTDNDLSGMHTNTGGRGL